MRTGSWHELRFLKILFKVLGPLTQTSTPALNPTSYSLDTDFSALFCSKIVFLR